MLGFLREERRREEEEEEEEGEENQVWITMGLYGFVNFCMDSWILGLLLCLGFCYEKF